MLVASLLRVEQLLADHASCRSQVASQFVSLENCTQQLALELVALRKQVTGADPQVRGRLLGQDRIVDATDPFFAGKGQDLHCRSHAVPSAPDRLPARLICLDGEPAGVIPSSESVPTPSRSSPGDESAFLCANHNRSQNRLVVHEDSNARDIVADLIEMAKSRDDGNAGDDDTARRTDRQVHPAGAGSNGHSVAGPETVQMTHAVKFRTKMDLDVVEHPWRTKMKYLVDRDHWRNTMDELLHGNLWTHLVQSPNFDTLVGFVIVANTLVMSLQIEVTGRATEPGHVPDGNDAASNFETSFSVAEHFFTAVFALELLMRLSVSGIAYLKNIANVGDAAIVLISSVDSWILTPMGSDSLNVGVLRLLRLLRLAKVLRVVRVMKAFSSLRVLVSAVVASIGALAWSMTLLFVLELIGAILLAQVLRPYIEDESVALDLRVWLWQRFGTWLHAMFTVFEITMAPGGFINYRRLSDELSPMFGLLIGAYVCLVTFAVVRVITAMFLKATLAASDKDEHWQGRETVDAIEAFAKKLTETLDAESETSQEIWISLPDLFGLLEIREMKKWCEEVDLQEPELRRLFKAMDDGRGTILFEDFVHVLCRMRGAPKHSDAIVTLYENQLIMKWLEGVHKVVARGAAEDGGGRLAVGMLPGQDSPSTSPNTWRTNVNRQGASDAEVKATVC